MKDFPSISQLSLAVIPAKAGTQLEPQCTMSKLDPRLRGDDGVKFMFGNKS